MKPPDAPGTTPSAPDPAPVIPEHTLLRVIGRGSSGRVWLAQSTLGTYRAVKVIPAVAQARFGGYEREVSGILKFEPLSRQHDGLVDILQVGFDAERQFFYYVMELADDVVLGQQIQPKTYLPQTLAQYRQKWHRLPVEECIRLSGAIASALSFLHKHGLTHRDIKPSNIIFVGGIPKLADIGLVADLAAPKARVGTEGFFPPEGSGSVRADIYALGKVLYELSTGNDRQAYPDIPADLMNQIGRSDFIQLNKIILKACRSRPWERYQSADQMLMALLNFQFATTALQRARRLNQFARLAGMVGVIIGLGVVGGLVWRLIDLLWPAP
ncbi:MAG TPA: serine/threonine-protein kinase [Dongiaceae bacterium]|nr:serine/threonine-protein kinase [Dongiaceae bacterium]